MGRSPGVEDVTGQGDRRPRGLSIGSGKVGGGGMRSIGERSGRRSRVGWGRGGGG